MSLFRKTTALITLFAATCLARFLPGTGEDEDRGDVPGWVMITMMSAHVGRVGRFAA